MVVMAEAMTITVMVVSLAMSMTRVRGRNRRGIIVVIMMVMTTAFTVPVFLMTTPDPVTGMFVGIRGTGGSILPLTPVCSESQGHGNPIPSARAIPLPGFLLPIRSRCSAGRITGLNNDRRSFYVRFRLLLVLGIVTLSQLRVGDRAAHGADTEHEPQADDGLLQASLHESSPLPSDNATSVASQKCFGALKRLHACAEAPCGRHPCVAAEPGSAEFHRRLRRAKKSIRPIAAQSEEGFEKLQTAADE